MSIFICTLLNESLRVGRCSDYKCNFESCQLVTVNIKRCNLCQSDAFHNTMKAFSRGCMKHIARPQGILTRLNIHPMAYGIRLFCLTAPGGYCDIDIISLILLMCWYRIRNGFKIMVGFFRTQQGRFGIKMCLYMLKNWVSKMKLVHYHPPLACVVLI